MSKIDVVDGLDLAEGARDSLEDYGIFMVDLLICVYSRMVAACLVNVLITEREAKSRLGVPQPDRPPGHLVTMPSAPFDHNMLRDLVIPHRLDGEILAKARLLEAAVRPFRGQRDVVVDPDGAELQLLGDMRMARPTSWVKTDAASP